MAKIDLHCECHVNTALVRNLLKHAKASRQDDKIDQILDHNKHRISLCASGSGTGFLLKNLEQPNIAQQITNGQKGDKAKKLSRETISQKMAQQKNHSVKVLFCDLDDNEIKGDSLKLKSNTNKYVENNFKKNGNIHLSNDTVLYLFKESNSKNNLIYIKPAAERFIIDIAAFYQLEHTEWGFPQYFEAVKEFCKGVQNDVQKQKQLDSAVNQLIQTGFQKETDKEQNLSVKPLHTLLEWILWEHLENEKTTTPHTSPPQ